MVLDGYSRYFVDHMELFGEWSFFGGVEAGRIETDLLKPMLSDMAGADHVDVRPISGLNCMTVAMGGLCPAGGTMYTVPVESGGHMSTTTVAERLGIRTVPLPMDGHHAIDLDRLAEQLKTDPPNLVYLDQSTQLFPIDPLPVRELLDQHAPQALLHYDSSHINGLILGGALPNPLDRGAHSFGGSTHKTLPGPHKAFLATNDRRVAEMTDDGTIDTALLAACLHGVVTTRVALRTRDPFVDDAPVHHVLSPEDSAPDLAFETLPAKRSTGRCRGRS